LYRRKKSTQDRQTRRKGKVRGKKRGGNEKTANGTPAVCAVTKGGGRKKKRVSVGGKGKGGGEK